MVNWKNKKEVNKYKKEWADKHREEIRKKGKEYYHSNKNKMKVMAKKYNSSEKGIKRRIKYLDNTREKRRALQKIRQKRYRKNNKEKIKKYNIIYYEQNQHKIKAQRIAQKIPIPKGQLCQDCGKILATERHHEDYDKPLDILFLCSICHHKNKGER